MFLCCYYAAWFTHNEKQKEAYSVLKNKNYVRIRKISQFEIDKFQIID